MEDIIALQCNPAFSGLNFIKALPTINASPFLGEGLALRAVIELTQAQRTKDQSHWHGMKRALEEALTLQDKLPLSSSLYRGVTGIGWAIQLCPPLLEKSAIRQFLAELDEILVKGIKETPSPNLDLINGIAGIIVYAIRRGRSNGPSEDLWSAIEVVCKRAVKTWLELSKRSTLEMHGTDFQKNLGLAHGIPGLLTMMVTAFKKGLLSQGTAELALDGFEQLWTHSIKGEGNCTLFPGTVGSEQAARLAWCYGALGLADAYGNASILDAANKPRFSSLVEGAISQFKSGKHLIMDASLCHGWAGAYLYFAAFAQSARLGKGIRDECKTASVEAGRALSGFNVGTEAVPSYLRYLEGKKFRSTSLLSGTSGVVLAQFAVANSPGRHHWAELLGTYHTDQ